MSLEPEVDFSGWSGFPSQFTASTPAGGETIWAHLNSDGQIWSI
jgi:hypothetical protein